MDRTALVRKAMEAIDKAASEINPTSSGNRLVNFAQAAVDAILPQISDPQQIRALPEGTWVMVPVQDGVVPMRWYRGLLWGDLTDGEGEDPEFVIEWYQSVTVVWEP